MELIKFSFRKFVFRKVVRKVQVLFFYSKNGRILGYGFFIGFNFGIKFVKI
jgi:hypothetical protein